MSRLNIYRFAILILLFSCTNSGTNHHESAGGAVRHDHFVIDATDTVSYIGYIHKFEGDDLFYTDLLFVEDFDYNRYHELARSSDDVVFKDSDFKRVRMKIDDIGQYFELKGLGRIDVYNRKGKRLTAGRLSHIEYVEDIIEGRFVAVFNVDNPKVFEPAYCVGNPKMTLSEIDIETYGDDALRQELISRLNLNADHVWNHEHYKMGNSIISTISADTTAFIVETLSDSQNILYKSKFNKAINEMTIIPWYVNGLPIILARCSKPETDVTWTSALVFNGQEYETRDYCRISHGE